MVCAPEKALERLKLKPKKIVESSKGKYWVFELRYKNSSGIMVIPDNLDICFS